MINNVFFVFDFKYKYFEKLINIIIFYIAIDYINTQNNNNKWYYYIAVYIKISTILAVDNIETSRF